MTTHTATYSPEDNKLRLYPAWRLDAAEYARVKAAGFIWAPKQELFVAPMWTPGREDLLIELADEIGDEDTSLVDRAEERADRFEDYSDSRSRDAKAAAAAADQISERFWGGQPILVGHHSEKSARKDQERMHNNMRRSLKMWETAGYWKARAAGALAAAKYKELPAVRARRIKALESDRRKQEKHKADAAQMIAGWEKIRALGNDQARQIDLARRFAGSLPYGGVTVAPNPDSVYGGWHAYDVLRPDEHRYQTCPAMTPDQVCDVAIPKCEQQIAYADRWIAHIDNRLTYERAMLGEAGGLITDRFEIEIGGQVLAGRGWFTVTKVNRGAEGRIVSVSCNARRGFTVNIEAVKDYRPATSDTVAAAREATSIPPLANYPGEGIVALPTMLWKDIGTDYRGTEVIPASEAAGRHRRRRASGIFIKPRALLPGWADAADDAARYNLAQRWYPVFITDAKQIDPPRPEASPNPAPLKVEPGPPSEPRAERKPDPIREKIAEAKAALAVPVKVVVVDQLFPTPSEVARQMVELAQITSDHRVLEPSAGAGNLLHAIGDGPGKYAIEVNQDLVRGLRLCGLPQLHVHHADFLTCTTADTGGLFDRVVMNPPFKNAADIEHILHARRFLKPGGLLVAICANGPRQNAKLKPMAMTWEELPEGTFASQGTGVRTVLLTMKQGGAVASVAKAKPPQTAATKAWTDLFAGA